jgi:hypothetical protein
MSPATSRRALQIAIAVAGLVPVSAGLAGVLEGPKLAFALGSTDLDSHFRYLSGLLLGLGLVFWSAIPSIERRGRVVQAMTLMVVIGGLARLYDVYADGAPGLVMRLALIMELGVTPLICLWQWRLALAMDGAALRR